MKKINWEAEAIFYKSMTTLAVVILCINTSFLVFNQEVLIEWLPIINTIYVFGNLIKIIIDRCFIK